MLYRQERSWHSPHDTPVRRAQSHSRFDRPAGVAQNILLGVSVYGSDRIPPPTGERSGSAARSRLSSPSSATRRTPIPSSSRP